MRTDVLVAIESAVRTHKRPVTTDEIVAHLTNFSPMSWAHTSLMEDLYDAETADFVIRHRPDGPSTYTLTDIGQAWVDREGWPWKLFQAPQDYVQRNSFCGRCHHGGR